MHVYHRAGRRVHKSSNANWLEFTLCAIFGSWVVIRIESRALRCVGPFGMFSVRAYVADSFGPLPIATHRRVQTLPGVLYAFAEGE